MPRKNSNLVLVRTGKNSEHTSWGPTNYPRDFDIIALTYSDPEKLNWSSDTQDKVEFEPGAKIGGLHRWMTKNSQIFEQYKYIMLLDDDLRTSYKDIDRIFEYAKIAQFELCQPALSKDSFYSLVITKSHASFLHRWTNAVEIMAPVFKSNILKQCLQTFAINPNGGGNIENLWGQHCSQKIGSIGIIDKIQIHHTRLAGKNGSGVDGNKDHKTPHHQQQMISALHCSYPCFSNFCGLTKEGKFLHLGDIDFIEKILSDSLKAGLEHHPKLNKLGRHIHADDLYRSYLNNLKSNYDAVNNCEPLEQLIEGLAYTSSLSGFIYQELVKV